ncbi:MAG: PKD domain-containing protein [Janthinobacterium lividum]
MPNTIAIIASKANTNKTVEYLHPTTGVWQDSNVLTNVPAGVYNLIQCRLKSSTPAITASWTQAVTVVGSGSSAPTNSVPVASAGGAATVQLPTSSLALLGTASDPDAGDSVTGAWRQLTGPSTAGGLPATSLNVVATGLVAGIYQFGFRATDSHGAQSAEDVATITVKAATSTMPTTFDLTLAGLFGCSPFEQAQTGYRQRSGQAVSPGITTGASTTQATFTIYSSAYQYYYETTPLYAGRTKVFIASKDGSFSAEIQVTAETGQYTVTVPSNTELVLTEGMSMPVPSDQLSFCGTYFTSVTCNGSATLGAYQRKSKRAIFKNDSIIAGDTTPNPASDGTLVLLRALLPDVEIAGVGWPGRAAIPTLATPSLRNAEAARMQAWLGSAAQKVIVYQLARNDGNSDTATFKSEVGADFDALNTYNPGVRILTVRPIYTSPDTSPSFEEKRTALAEIVQGRTTYADYLDTSNVFTAANASTYLTAEGANPNLIHPNKLGSVKLAQFLQAPITTALSQTTTTAQPVASNAIPTAGAQYSGGALEKTTASTLYDEGAVYDKALQGPGSISMGPAARTGANTNRAMVLGIATPDAITTNTDPRRYPYYFAGWYRDDQGYLQPFFQGSPLKDANGNNYPTGTYAHNDNLGFGVLAGTIQWLQNGIVMFSRAVTMPSVLVPDVALSYAGFVVSGVTITPGNGGTVIASGF